MKQLIAINVFQCELKSQSKGKGFKRTFLTIDDCPSWCFWARLSRKHWWDVGNLGTIAQICRCLSVQRCRLVLRAVTFVGVSELERCPWTLSTGCLWTSDWIVIWVNTKPTLESTVMWIKYFHKQAVLSGGCPMLSTALSLSSSPYMASSLPHLLC